MATTALNSVSERAHLAPGILCKVVDLYVVEARAHFQMAVVFLLTTENQKVLLVPEKQQMKEISN